MDVEMQRLQEILVEYSYWDQGYEKAVLSTDQKWVESNYGEYLVETYGFAFALIMQNNDKILFSTSADNSPTITKSTLIESGIDKLMSQSRNVLSIAKDIGGYVCIKGEPYMVAVGPFIDENTGKPRPDNSYVLFGKKVEENYLDSISRLYHLPSLDVSSNPSSQKLSIIILDHPDCPEVRLVCDPPDANWAILSILLPIITLLGACTFGLSWFLLNRHNHFRSMYEANLYEMAVRDSLTGAYTRREFMNLGKEAFRQQGQNDRHLSVLMLDLDHFKSINDQYGHSTGDSNLKVFVKILNSCVRGRDIIGRLGGEEFAAILVETDAGEAYKIAERVRVQTEKVTGKGRDGIVPMTVSIGVVNVEKGVLKT